MSVEHHHAEARSGPPGDPGVPGPGDDPRDATSGGAEDAVSIDGGWLLVQRDWSLRQPEPRTRPIVAQLRRRIAAVAAWLRRRVLWAFRRTVQEGPR